MAPRSSFATAALALLAIAAFGGLSVGIPTVFAQLTSQSGSASVVPAVALAYGLVSAAGFLGILRGWRLVVPLVVVSQGFVAVALLAAYAGTPDWSLLVLAAIAAGAAVCALLDARTLRT
jgi:hypothetical protein